MEFSYFSSLAKTLAPWLSPCTTSPARTRRPSSCWRGTGGTSGRRLALWPVQCACTIWFYFKSPIDPLHDSIDLLWKVGMVDKSNPTFHVCQSSQTLIFPSRKFFLSFQANITIQLLSYFLLSILYIASFQQAPSFRRKRILKFFSKPQTVITSQSALDLASLTH